MTSVEESAKAENNFIYNNMLACALLQIFPKKDRIQIRKWLEKLQNVSGGKEKLAIRDRYMWLLLLMMQNGYFVEPFDNFPPEVDLIPISEIISPKVEKEISARKNENFSWIDEVIMETNTIDESRTPVTGVAPCRFLDQQPKPTNGAVAYFSVFSKKS